MALTLDEARRIASLARLRPSREEEHALPAELSRVVALVAHLGEFPGPDGAEVAAGPDAGGDPPALREAEDEPGECLPREAVLANAPAHHDGFIRVPPVLPAAEGSPRGGTPHPGGAPTGRRVRPAAADRRSPAPGPSPGAWRLSAEDLAARVRRRELRAEDAVRSCLARIARVEPAVGAFVRLDGEAALERARELDRRLDAGDDPGPLAGVPVAVKENLSLAGRPLTCASRILQGYSAPFTATAVARLEAAGAVVLGQTNLDEFAMGSSTETSAAGPTVNPRNPVRGPRAEARRVPGGSSGGSAAAVAAGTVPLALGSDTGGSVRQPAAFCGAVGLRPTWGRVSRWGLVAHASSLDTVGPIARTVRDAALALGVLAGPDPRDATSADRPAEDPSAGLEEGIEGLRVGRLRELNPSSPAFVGDGVAPAAREAWEESLDLLETLGARVVEVSIPAVASALAAYYLIATSEASSNLARFDGVRYGLRAGGGDLCSLYEESRSRGFGAEVKRRILLGTFALSAGYEEEYYGRARTVRRALAAGFAAAFRRADVVAAPTAAGGAFPLGARTADPVAMYRSDLFTVPAALAGLPAVSVPAGADSDGLPLGLQVMGPAFAEARVLRAARAFEAATELPFAPVAEPAPGRAA